MSVRALRGATQLEVDERDHLLSRVRELLTEILTVNELTAEDFISVIFTVTADVRSEFPAVAARELGFGAVPLLCTTEIDVPGSLPRVVRLLAHVETSRQRDAMRHVYLHGARALRLDLAQ
ncbi:MAG: chorismate mutase [Actinomycetes bacterium]